jgi:ATP-dependent Clp protease ATP-binding subunit ClpC
MGAVMVVAPYNYRSSRAEKSRLSIGLGGVVPPLLIIVTSIFIFAGLGLLLIGMPIGWALVGFAAVPAMIVEWKNGELTNLAPHLGEPTIDNIMDAEILGHLSHQPTPQEIASLVSQVYGGQFFAARFGIGSGFLQELASPEVADMAALWDNAVQIARQVDAKTVTSGVLTVALVKMHPNHDALLAHFQLSLDDLMNGLRWQQHINDLIAHNKMPKKTGGIGRDWSFGWTPTLSEFGQNISNQVNSLLTVNLESHIEALDHLISMLVVSGDGSAALIGPDGVGKTTIVYALAEKLMQSDDVPSDLKYQQIFMLDAASLISSAPGRGQLEALVTKVLNEAYSAKNIIICFDNAQLFFEEGIGSVDISNLLQPIIEAGRMRMIFAMDDQRYLRISQRNAKLANSLARIIVSPPEEDETIAVMQDQLTVVEFRRKVTFMYQAVREAYRLSQRYVHDLAMPGRAVNLLDASAEFAEDGLVTARSVQIAIEKTQDVKVGVADDEAERAKLLNLESLIHERMINQTKAVSAVSDALRRARAGVRNQDRPIGAFMFLGPTGVGKTELAKALASVYFGGEDQIIRLDMNEYVSSGDVSRLIADGADDGNSLTARVIKQPFSVILLDEIEKAHPSILATLLQLLDEGTLRDVKNREVSFKDAIVIATSNAGADRIREQIERGLSLDGFQDQFVDELIKSNQFAPEFLNRFDEIVLFRPLDKPELLQVVDLILAGVNKTLDQQKLSVVVAQDAKEYLVENGYDPKLGARPMRRIVQRAVENTVARKVLSGEAQPGGTIEISLDQVKELITSKAGADSIVSGVSI